MSAFWRLFFFGSSFSLRFLAVTFFHSHFFRHWRKAIAFFILNLCVFRSLEVDMKNKKQKLTLAASLVMVLVVFIGELILQMWEKDKA